MDVGSDQAHAKPTNEDNMSIAMNSATVATYTKLKSGEWGVRIPCEAAKGERATVAVRTKAGDLKYESVVVIWSGSGVSLCSINRNCAVSGDRSAERELASCRRRGWDGRVGSSSYYSSGAFDEIDM